MHVRTQSPSHAVSPRAGRAARERTVTLRVISFLSILAVVSVALGTAAGLASPFVRTPSGPRGGVQGSRVASIAAAPAPLGATPDVASSDGSAEQDRGASAATEPIAPSDSSQAQVPDDPGVTVWGVKLSDQSGAKSSAPAGAVASKATAKRQAIAESVPSAAKVAAAPAAAAAAGSSSSQARGAITIVTFGYDFGGPPSGCKFVADVRNIDAGSFLQSETGLMPAVRERIMATSAAQAWLSVLRTQWMPSLKAGDMVAIGCSKGRHRSVALGVVFAEDLRAQGYAVNLVHRDILKTW